MTKLHFRKTLFSIYSVLNEYFGNKSDIHFGQEL